MKYDELNLQKLRALPIFEVCSKLGITLYGMGKLTRRATCWYHADKHPSMHVNKKKNIYKCFVCGKGGDVIRLVQDYENKTFIEACDWLVNEFHVVLVENCPTRSQISDISFISAGPKTTLVPLDPVLVKKSLSVDSVFCKSVVSEGYLSQVQLVAATNRYRLGASKEGGVIFWEIDDLQQVHTGKIMYYQQDCHRDKNHTPTWVHSLMKDKLPAGYELQHCLFGLHLLGHTDSTDSTDKISAVSCVPVVASEQSSSVCSENKSVSSVQSVAKNNSVVSIVESEKTAVIMSVLCPECIWMSCGGLQMFKPELLAPLVNHKVVIFPDTDETGEAFKQWHTVLQQASKLYTFKYPLRISRLLEDHATPNQKSRKIDLVDYIFDGHTVTE